MSRIDSVLGALLFLATLLLVATWAWAYFKLEVGIEEGTAKAQMIERLTGIEFTPEVAKHATVTFTGTTVQIETHALNVWEGQHAGWREAK